VFAALAVPMRAAAFDLWVDQSNLQCSDVRTREQVTLATPWCSIAAAATAARAGDTVHVRPGSYIGTVRPAASGWATDPIRDLADGDGVTLDAAGASVGLKIIGVSGLAFDGFTITGAASQGVYMSSASAVTLSRLVVSGNGGHGIQLRASSVTISDSTLSDNGLCGINELPGSSGNVYRANLITGNGKDGNPYSGDGIQMHGAGTVVTGNTITDNGDPGPFEHGIYAAAVASAYLIESNALSGNAGSNIKAAGADGTVRYNRLSDTRLGIVFSDNSSPVVAYYNLIVGSFQHAAFFTTGTTAARGRLWNNTIVQTGRLTTSGDASAVFVTSAALADVRNNLICYTNPDSLGTGLWINNASLVSTLVSNNNWVCSTDASQRHFAWNGSRTTFAGWKTASGQDGASVVSTPPTLDGDFRVVSTNLGRRKGQRLGLKRDYVGTPVPTRRPDASAYQTPQ
jgi:parallel beta-helix repeat protein